MRRGLRFCAVLVALGLIAAVGGLQFSRLRDPAPATASSSGTTGTMDLRGVAPAVPLPPGPSRGDDRLPVEAGRRVFIDPVTGRPGPPPALPAAAQVPDVASPLSTSAEGLRETPGMSRAGGVTVHLQGRFQSTMTATVQPDGTVALRCGPGSAPCARADCSEHAPAPPVNPPK